MEENKRKRINVDITEKEAEIVDAVLPQIKQNLSAGVPADYNIPRIQFEMVSKYITPFVVVAHQFAIGYSADTESSSIYEMIRDISIYPLLNFLCQVVQIPLLNFLPEFANAAF